MSAVAFEAFLNALKVSNREDISKTYRRITARLNSDFRSLESDSLFSLQVGSFGRRTAIDGISDLDMVYEMPSEDFARFDAYQRNGPSALLQEIRQSLLESYPRTRICGDGPVVVVPLRHHHFEVLPAFKNEDGSYTFGVTKDDGSWEITQPRAERDAFQNFDNTCNGNLRNAAKMLRAWKNTSGAPLGGWLIDTLTFHFFLENTECQTADLNSYPELITRLFEYLASQDDNGTWLAPGSNDPVYAKGKFTPRAKKALGKCRDALQETELLVRCKKWRAVFGRKFQLIEEVYKGDLRKVVARTGKFEQFIDDRFPVNVVHDLKIDYEVTGNKMTLWEFAKIPRRYRQLPLGKGLRFYIASTTTPEPFEVFWKIRNHGPKSRGRERGEITADGGQRQRVERTAFSGGHYVEAYLVKDGMCVAIDRAEVPIID